MSRSGKNIHRYIGAIVLGLCSAQFSLADTAVDPVLVPNSADLSSKTDAELTELTAQWSTLSPSERRTLLAEVRGRMAANQQALRPMGIRVQRRYGRVVRKADGSVVVQTRVVRVRPREAQPATSSRPTVTFGIGFEQRSKSRAQSSSDGAQTAPARSSSAQSAPTVTVSQQQKSLPDS